MSSVYGNAVGGITGYGKTFILTDEDGNEIVGTVVEDVTIFDANPVTDIREGKVAVTDQGVVVGSKNIPAYRTERGYCMIFSGDPFEITDMREYDMYDYTELQCIITLFNTTFENSVEAEKVVLFNNIYSVKSSTPLSSVSKDASNKSIKLNIMNDSDNDYIIHYFMYRKEE